MRDAVPPSPARAARRARRTRPRPIRTGIALAIAAWLCAALSCSRAAPGDRGPDESGLEAIDPGRPAGWLVRGPFPVAASPFRDGLDVDFLAGEGGEAAAAPGRIQAAGRSAWRELEGDPASVDFLAAFGAAAPASRDGAEPGSALPSADCAAYAYREVELATAGEAVLKLGSDDGVKVWIDGLPVFAHRVRRALSPDEDAVIVDLAAGRRRVLVKVDQGSGSWGFALRIRGLAEDRSEGEAAAFTGLRVALDRREAAAGTAFEGYAMSDPAFCLDEAATIELRDPRGRALAATEARLGRRFSLPPPAGYEGPCRVVARGSGRLAGLSGAAWAIAGDGPALAAAAAARARAEAATAGAGFPDRGATLLFLADLVEGKLPSALCGFDPAAQALAELGELAEGRALPLPGAARYAFRSAVDGSLQPYSLYLPAAGSVAGGGAALGLAAVLHGMTVSDWAALEPFAAAAPADFAVLAPYARGDLGYSGPAERDVLDLLDAVEESCAIDGSRVYLTGSSMGGYGTWRLGRLWPGRFAALAPFAGWTETAGIEALAGTPILAVHGEADETVPAYPDRAAVAALAGLGSPARLELLGGVGHEAFAAWSAAGGAGRLLEWFRGRRLEPWPAKLSLRGAAPTRSRGGSRGTWAAITAQAKPRESAGLDARVIDGRHVAVDTDNVAAFELDLSHPALERGGRILLLVDGANLTADAGSRAALVLGPGGRFRVERPSAASRVARNGGRGLAALFEGPVRIVYGTRSAARAPLLRAAALALADWGPKAGRSACQVLGSFPVMSDEEALRAEAGQVASILVGSPAENLLAARLEGSLPVAFGRGSATVGGRRFERAAVLLVVPDPEEPSRLVAVFAPPAGREEAVALASGIASSLREFGGQDSSMGPSTPDVAVYDDSGAVAWAASFDRGWERLVEEREE